MPNWCMNTLEVHGNPANVNEFIDGIKNNPLTHESDPGVPYFSILETYAPLPGGKWDYDKAIQYWGTKWSDSGLRMPDYRDSDTAYFSFDSPWGPPLGGISRISEDFSTLIFGISFIEPGMGFAGGAVFYEGNSEYEFDEDIPYFDYDADPDKANDDEMTYWGELDNRVAALVKNVSNAIGGK